MTQIPYLFDFSELSSDRSWAKHSGPRRFYVYAHWAPGWSTPFYIGKGAGHRAWAKTGRNPDWQEHAKNGFWVQIVKGGMHEVCALSFEKILIDRLGLDWLTNRATGGFGVSGIKHTAESNEKRRVAMSGPKNHNYGKRPPPHVIQASIDCRKGVKQSLETRLKRSETQRGLNHSQLDKRVCIFENEDGLRYEGLRYNFIKDTSCSPPKVCNLIQGKRKMHKGWRFIGFKENNT